MYTQTWSRVEPFRIHFFAFYLSQETNTHKINNITPKSQKKGKYCVYVRKYVMEIEAETNNNAF